MQLNTVRAVVTGGVSGLGFAVAQHLVANGGKVALFDVNDDKGAAAVAALGAGQRALLHAPTSPTRPAWWPTSPPRRNSSAA